MSSSTPGPFVSVAIRSYMRLDYVIELVERCLAQDYPSFEVVVIEQSEPIRERYRAELTRLQQDPRVRILEYGKLGYIGARNEGIRQSRGEVILFMDDDDLPVGRDWIANHAKNYLDPKCVAVIGREVDREDEDPTRHDSWLAHKQTLAYSPILKFPSARNRHSKRIEGVQSIKGGGCSIRRSAIERVGLWDADLVGLSHEERWFDFRFQRLREPGEYYVYDPTAVMLRRKEIEGGMDRRSRPVESVLMEELVYSHKVIRHFFPARFYAFYPAYLAVHSLRTLRWFHESQPGTPLPKVALGLAKAFVPTLKKAWR